MQHEPDMDLEHDAVQAAFFRFVAHDQSQVNMDPATKAGESSKEIS